MKSKKGEGLTMQTIVVAIIALVVLVTLLLIYFGVLGDVVPFFDTVNCKGRGGECKERGQCSGGTEIIGLGCPLDGEGDDRFCCIP